MKNLKIKCESISGVDIGRLLEPALTVNLDGVDTGDLLRKLALTVDTAEYLSHIGHPEIRVYLSLEDEE